MKSQKILLWGWFGFENLGDDLLLNTMLENLSPYSGTITVPMRSQYDIKYQNVKQIERNYTALFREIPHNDMLIIGKEGYHRRQEENNPENNLTQGYLNVLDSILSLYYERYDFFQHVVPETNPYLAFRFYRILLDTVESHTDKLKASYSLKYSARQIAGFICFGLFGFISESYTSKVPLEQVQAGARQLLTDLLQSKILV